MFWHIGRLHLRASLQQNKKTKILQSYTPGGLHQPVKNIRCKPRAAQSADWSLHRARRTSAASCTRRCPRYTQRNQRLPTPGGFDRSVRSRWTGREDNWHDHGDHAASHVTMNLGNNQLFIRVLLTAQPRKNYFFHIHTYRSKMKKATGNPLISLHSLVHTATQTKKRACMTRTCFGTENQQYNTIYTNILYKIHTYQVMSKQYYHVELNSNNYRKTNSLILIIRTISQASFA